ncbi:hypothetical protein [Embleya sp. AB8]|uniref:hypothetical protein n=1 Tax=Embleya sp. AB8 TaxID=3156304 RepID=UPI003C77FEDD
MARYFIAPDDTQFVTHGGMLAQSPEGWEEVGAEEYTARLAARKEIGAERASAWIATERCKERDPSAAGP